MLIFNELRVHPDRKHLIIDVEVLDLDYYENVNIGTIIIDTLKTYIETGPSASPLFTIECGDVKHYRAFIDIDTITDNLFFVYVVASGTPADDTPCGMKDSIILGVTYDKYPIYRQSMKMLNATLNCEPSKVFIDYILLLKAFNICLEIGNYTKAIEYWNMFFANIKPKIVNNRCGCHG